MGVFKYLRNLFARPRPNTTEQAVLEELNRNQYDVWTLKDFTDVVGVGIRDMPTLQRTLKVLVAKGEIYQRNHSRVIYYRKLPFS